MLSSKLVLLDKYLIKVFNFIKNFQFILTHSCLKMTETWKKLIFKYNFFLFVFLDSNTYDNSRSLFGH